MNDKYFLDTNILVYLVDQSSSNQKVSQHIVLNALRSGNGIISSQVIQEFLNLATGKFFIKFKSTDITNFLNEILFPLCLVYPDFELFESALDIKAETHYSFYDSLIIAAALRANCGVLYTEDMQSGQSVRGLEIVNPYLPGVKLIQ
jgi:predicted nucleic acid-binding protein